MKFEQIKELIELLNNSNIGEFKFETPELNLSIRTKDYFKTKEVMVQSAVAAQPMSYMPAPISHTPENKVVVTENKDQKTGNTNEENTSPQVKLLEVKSPMVGTFYRSSSPDKPAFVKVGDTITADTTVCLIEAMKLFNDVKAEISGKIVKVMVEDASPVEYEQVLFLVEPN